MGTRYIRLNPLPSELKLVFSDIVREHEIVVEHIIAHPPIGNELWINIKQGADNTLGFIEISLTATESVLKLNGAGVEPGTYELIIESFDENSTVKTTLKKDTI